MESASVAAPLPGGLPSIWEVAWKEYQDYAAVILDEARFRDCPALISVETYMKCNASCEFCPYTKSSRIGGKLSDEIMKKIVDEASEAAVHPMWFVTARVNEPMLDVRIHDYHDYIGTRLPTTKIGLFTNGTTLSPNNVERLQKAKNIGYIKISLNEFEKKSHYDLMKINFDIVRKNLDNIHAKAENGEFSFYTMLGRVGDGTERDEQFVSWCRENYPLFHATVAPRFDWLGKTFGADLPSPSFGCLQWYQLHFLANGKEAFCCIDDDGRFGLGDIRVEHVLSIYNHPVRRGLRGGGRRQDHPVCAGCKAWL